MAAFADLFTRANDAASLGGAWTAQVGTWGILGNAAYSSDADTQTSIATHAGLDSNGTVRLVIPGPMLDGESTGVVARYVDVDNHIVCRLLRNSAVSYELLIRKRVAAVNTAVDEDLAFPVPSFPFTLGLRLAGGNLTAFGNGTAELAGSLGGDLATGTVHGLRRATGNSQTVDTFVWSAGAGAKHHHRQLMGAS